MPAGRGQWLNGERARTEGRAGKDRRASGQGLNGERARIEDGLTLRKAKKIGLSNSDSPICSFIILPSYLHFS